MISSIFNFLFPATKTDLQIVLDIINDSHVYNILDTDPVKDQQFYLDNKYTLRFGKKDFGCALHIYNGEVPLFVFSEQDEITIIRQSIMGKLTSEAVSQGV